MRPTADPIDDALREADVEAEEAAAEAVDVVRAVEDWQWLMSHPQGRRIARRLIGASPHDDEFYSNFGMMSWKSGQASFVRKQLIGPMRAASLELFHAMEREEDGS